MKRYTSKLTSFTDERLGDMRRTSRAAFTLIELMVVISLILLLMSMMIFTVNNFIVSARETATATTVRKISGMIKQRSEALRRKLDDNPAIMEKLVDAKLARLKAARVFGVSRKAAEVLVYKDNFRAFFPQYLDEVPNGTIDDKLLGVHFGGVKEWRYPDFKAYFEQRAPYDHLIPEGADNGTTNAEILYFVLTQADVFGVPPVDTSEFLTSELGDTDGDGRLEFLDSWGNPLRFYRWPTRLIRPGGGNINRSIASILIQGLPAAPRLPTDWDLLNEDPEDPLGLMAIFPPSAFEDDYHTMDTYSLPLVVSAGQDYTFGLGNPWEHNVAAGQFGYLAQPTVINSAIPAYAEMIDQLTDNITNHNHRIGD